MGLDGLSDAELVRVAERATAEDETIHLMPGVITIATVLGAIKGLEILMAEVRVR